ncbi:SDR family NAD(P)-dependent oxidoreductase [Nocardia sp. NPDC059239]|uniref:SDR family NAD(P)-dependent oxidoreductase n=1 Tax=unclassified Nocardia TaxID=2637762 RepID=UPI00369BFE4C
MVQSAKPLAGKVALVTGASRGVGKGAAIGLGEAGATVYVTARASGAAGNLPGTARQTADEVTAAGGKGIALLCDHTDDAQVDAVIERIKADEGGLDVLVNSVYSAPGILTTAGPKMPGGAPFWETPVEDGWEAAFTLGVRAHYVATRKAMPLLLDRSGLIVDIGSPGNYVYVVSTLYGMGKAADERMVALMAQELEDYPVSILTLWPGVVRTEVTGNAMDHDPATMRSILRLHWERVPGGEEDLARIPDGELMALTQSPTFTGRAIAALASDPNVKAKSGTVISVPGAAKEYGFTDVDGTIPDGLRYLDTEAWPPLAPR